MSYHNELAQALLAIAAALEAGEPASPAKPTSGPKRQPKAAKSVQPKAAKTRCLVKANRREFVEAHAWAKGLSTLDIAIAVVHHGRTLEAGWTLGAGYADKARAATKAAIKAVA